MRQDAGRGRERGALGTSGAFLAGVVAAAGLAAAAWFLRVAPAQEEADSRLAEAEETARRKTREASDARSWADTERERNRVLEDRVRELEHLLDVPRAQGAPAPDGAASGAGAPRDPVPPPKTVEVPPEEWDRQRLNQEIENLARIPESVQRHARYPLVLKALRLRGAEGVDLVRQMLKARLDGALTATAAALAEGLGDPGLVPFLAERWATATDPASRHMILRALANLPGDDALPIFRAAWSEHGADPESPPDASIRRFAIHGLALRADPLALQVATTRGEAPAALRARAVESLHRRALRGEWKETSLLEVFRAVLRTADGPEQQTLALLALEGFWSKDALADVDAFAADPAVSAELAARARKLADALRAGSPRPADAGVPKRTRETPPADDVGGDTGGAGSAGDPPAGSPGDAPPPEPERR